MQVGFVDRKIGKLIAHLKAEGLYDRSLIIITADHGVSHLRSDFRRPISPTDYTEIMCLPLFVKVPHQRQGAVIDRNVDSVDILPTIAGVLGIDLPWPVDGQSALDFYLRRNRNLRVEYS